MRALIDAQLPPALCGWFAEQGVEAEHVSVVLGGQTSDAVIAFGGQSKVSCLDGALRSRVLLK